MFIHRDLRIYKLSYALAAEIHQLTLRWSPAIQFDIGTQMRRAARSIPSNIAEGYGRHQSKKEIIHYLRMALGSYEEIIFNLAFCKDGNLIGLDEHNRLNKEYSQLGKQLNCLINNLKKLDN